MDIRKRVRSRLTSTYVDVYSENLYQLLLRNAKEHVPEFKRKLVDFYEGENIEVISDFLKEKCWKTF